MAVSVIIPTYNSEKTIKPCLDALYSQNFKGNHALRQAFLDKPENYEVIVVDDGSTDGTSKIVKSFKNAKFFKKQHNGPAAARNFGAKMAHGSILLFTDSDCEPDANWIAEMVEPFSKDKELAGVSGTYRTRQTEIIARFAQYEIEERHQKMSKMDSIDFIGTFSAGYRKEIFQRFNGFDESFSTSAGEDPELSFRIAEAGHRMVFAPKAFVYHTHPDTIGKYLRQKYRNAYWRVAVYAKRKKTFKTGHSYTPKSAMLEAITIPLFAVVLFFSMSLFLFSLFSIPISLIAIWFAAYFSSHSLITYIFRRDPVLGFVSPYIIFLRAFATAFGISFGLLRRFFK